MDLLGLDDLLGGTSLAPPPTAQPQQPPPPPPLQLRPQPQLSPQVFQQKWGALTNIAKFQHSLSPSAMAFIEANKHQVCTAHLHALPACTVATPSFLIFHMWMLISLRYACVPVCVCV